MTTSHIPTQQGTQLGREVLRAARYYVSGRRGLIALAVVTSLAGLAFNWSWLVAAGVAPILIAALPCVAMCALGLCMSRMSGSTCAADKAQAIEPPRSIKVDADGSNVIPIAASRAIDTPAADAAPPENAEEQANERIAAPSSDSYAASHSNPIRP